MSNTSQAPLSSLVGPQIPEFIRVDHPVFVSFLEAYFEWLENGYSGFSVSRIRDVNDIDKSIDAFVNQFRSQYLLNFPKNLATDASGRLVDEALLVKRAKEFYRTKGSEASFRFLFRVLYGVEVDVYLPKTDIIKVSGGRFIQQTSIRTTSSLGLDIFAAVGRRIRQINPFTNEVIGYARVERIIQYRIDEFPVSEIFVTGIQNDIVPGFPIAFETEDKTKIETSTYSVLNQISISKGGRGHVVGEKIQITSPTGKGAKAEVSRIGAVGDIKKVRILDCGVNYTDADDITLTFEQTEEEIQQASDLVTSQLASGSNPTLAQFEALVQDQFTSGAVGASGSASIGSIFRPEGFYSSESSQISSLNVLQDNRYYQDFSYVLKTEIVVSRYRDAVKALLHPAGMAFFGSVSIKRCNRADLDASTSVIQYEMPLIGQYTPYTLKEESDLSEVYPNGYFSPFENQILSSPGSPLSDPFWIIFPHPNSRNIEGIPPFISFGEVVIEPFLKIKTGYQFDCALRDVDDVLTA